MGTYYRTSAAARRLSINWKTVSSVAAAGRVRCRNLPGQPVEYCAEDIDRIARESIKIAGTEPEAAAVPARAKRRRVPARAV